MSGVLQWELITKQLIEAKILLPHGLVIISIEMNTLIKRCCWFEMNTRFTEAETCVTI